MSGSRGENLDGIAKNSDKVGEKQNYTLNYSADTVGGHACFQNTCNGMAGSRKYYN